MTEHCEDLDPFFDRELGAEAAREFRDHLPACARCREVLLGRMLEAAVVADHSAGQPSTDRVPTPAVDVTAAASERGAETANAPGTTGNEPVLRCRRPLTIAAVIALPAAAMAAVLIWSGHERTEVDRAATALSSALGPERDVEVRFSAPQLDRYRPRRVVRSAAPTEPGAGIGLQVLSELEQRGDLSALVGAYALNGELASARRAAGRLARTAQSLADGAALELLHATAAARAADTVPSPIQAAAERALSLTAEALRLDPRCAQARWNRAVALTALGLSLAAAQALDDVAELHEAGWSDEARAKAAELRRDYQDIAGAWKRAKNAADRMVAGGPVLGEDAVAGAPSLARDAFYLALATAATVERIDALAPLAHALDARFATTAPGDVLQRVRRSRLAARAPVAAELRAFLADPASAAALTGLRGRAVRLGLRDIALASFLAAPERLTDDDDLALLDRLLVDQRDDWWKLVALARGAYVAEFRHRDHPAVDAIERRAEPLCKAIRSTWCGRILVFAGGANSQMGRADLAIEQIATARRQAKAAAAPDDELDALDALGEAIADRVTGDLDAAAVADGYLHEVALREPVCQTRLQRLDFAAIAALQHHRFDEAARHSRDGDALERELCRDWGLRLNGEMARLQLVLHGHASVATLRDNVAQLRSHGWPNAALYLDFLDAAATVVDDRSRGEAALRLVLARANAEPAPSYAAQVRAGAFDVLVESAARSGDGRAVAARLAERLRVPGDGRCVLGVASWNRLIVAALDGDGRAALDTREIPEGTVMIPTSKVVSSTMRAHLAGCRRVDVVAPGPYFGAAGLLEDRVAWVYRTGAPRTAREAAARRELVVSGVTPPDDLHLPALRPFSGGAGAELLSGARATPAGVLAAMRTASLAVIVAHGLTDAEEPTAASLILSPDPQGDYLLTAAKVRAARFEGSPIVVLAGCDAGRVQVGAEPWSLATSFLAAGARAVIAPTEPIPDDSANDVFRSLIDRIRAGVDPVDAVVAERSSRGAAAAWLSSIVMFE